MCVCVCVCVFVCIMISEVMITRLRQYFILYYIVFEQTFSTHLKDKEYWKHWISLPVA